MTINNDILFRRKTAVTVNLAGLNGKPSDAAIAAGLRELENLGYRPSAELFAILLHTNEAVDTLKKIIALISEKVKANRSYVPMYPNFPAQVMEVDEAELYINAMLHYLGDLIGARILPQYVEKDREPYEGYRELIELHFGNQADFDEIFTDLVSMKTSWSDTDKADAGWFLRSDNALVWPDTIPNKENLAWVALNTDPQFAIDRAATATDLLRIAVVLSGGDATLNGIGVAKVKFKSFSKPVRRAFVRRLDELNYNSTVEDMLRNTALWKLFLHTLHVGDFAKQYPNVANAANVVRNNGKGFETFNSKVEKYIAGAPLLAAKLLESRPGDFARRLDQIVRKSNSVSAVNSFAKVANKVSTPVLWQLSNFYNNRELYSGGNSAFKRVYSPKGKVNKVVEIEKALPAIPSATITKLRTVINDALVEQYRANPKLKGTVEIDPELFNYTIPFGERSASAALNPVGRGTRVSLGDEAIARLFIWWRDGVREGSTQRAGYGYYSQRVDIDLSAFAIDENFTRTDTVSYYSLRSGWAVHSGDITSAPNGAAEFLDVNKAQALQLGYRYIGISITSYTGQSFDSLNECFGGVMARNTSQTGKVFDARTVQNAFDVTSPSRFAVPFVVDLKENVMIWTDMSIDRSAINGWGYNVANHQNAFLNAVKATVSRKSPTIGDLLIAHGDASGSTTWDETSNAKPDHKFTITRGRIMYNDKVLSHADLLSNWL